MGEVRAVIEAESVGNAVPWPVSIKDQGYMIALSGNLSDDEVGYVVAVWATVAQISVVQPPTDILEQIIESPSSILPGGIELVGDDGTVISPACCCGLEGWREWLAFMKNGQSPWMGHSPDYCIQATGERLSVFEDGFSQAPNKLATSLDFKEFADKLSCVESELLRFTELLHTWVSKIEPALADALCAKFKTDFVYFERS